MEPTPNRPSLRLHFGPKSSEPLLGSLGSLLRWFCITGVLRRGCDERGSPGFCAGSCSVAVPEPACGSQGGLRTFHCRDWELPWLQTLFLEPQTRWVSQRSPQSVKSERGSVRQHSSWACSHFRVTARLGTGIFHSFM